MSVYIKGMEMPTEGTVIAIYKRDGKFYASVHGTELCPLVPIPPHGRLIDADALKDTLDYYISEAGWSDEINEALTWVRDEFIDHELTIIEAEEVSE